MDGGLEDNAMQPSHETLDVMQRSEPQINQISQATMQDSNGNTTSPICATLKQEPLEKITDSGSPVDEQDSSSMERMCIADENVEMHPSENIASPMLVANSRPGEIPIIVPSGKTIYLSDQFTAVLIRPESLLYGMEVPVIKKENSQGVSNEHVVGTSAETEAAGSASDAAVQVPWLLQVGQNSGDQEHAATYTTEDGQTKEVTAEPIVTAPDAASATPKTPYMFTSKDRTFTCEFCPNITFTRGQLRKHKTVHTGQRNYVCGVCNKRFAVKHSLMKHMVLHSGQSPFPCGQCGKGFSTAYHLQHHVRSHDPERQYKCTQCDKMFAKPEHLVVHIRTHSGEETFPCAECGKSFTTKLGLNTHMRVHGATFSTSTNSTGTAAAALYTCGLCGLQVGVYSDLVSHAKTHGEQEHAALVSAQECVVVCEEREADRTRSHGVSTSVPTTVISSSTIMPAAVTSVNGVGTA